MGRKDGVGRNARIRGALAATFVFALAVLAPPGPRAGPAETKRLTLEPYGIGIEYRAADERVASAVASIIDETTPVIKRQLGLADVQPIRVLLIPDVGEFEERSGFRLPSWGVAFAFPGHGFVLVDVKRATNAWNSLDEVIPHEMSHMFLSQRVPGVPMPLWFVEGLAQWQAGQWSVVENWRLMESVWNNSAPRLDQFAFSLPPDERRTREAYRVAYEAFQYRFDRRMDVLHAYLDEVVRQGNFGEAFEAFWQEGESAYYERFARHLESKYKSGLMLFQPGPLFTLVSVLFVLVVLSTWIRNRRKLKRMEEGERMWPTALD